MPYTPNFAAGDVLTAANMNSIGEAWTSFGSASSFQAFTTNPTLGTGGSWTAFYSQINKVVRVRGRIVWGSTGRNVGSGAYWINLPVTARTGQDTSGSACGSVMFGDVGGLLYPGYIILGNTTTAQMWYIGDTGLDVINLNQLQSGQYPHTVGANDYIDFTFTYEAA